MKNFKFESIEYEDSNVEGSAPRFVKGCRINFKVFGYAVFIQVQKPVRKI